MNDSDSLKDIERRAYRSTFNDGLYEIGFGLIAIILAWIPVLESLGIPRVIGYLLLILPVAIPWIGKRLVTTPRLGLVEFGPKRKAGRRLRLILLAAVVILMLPVVMLLLLSGNFGGSAWQLIALIVAPLIAVGVYALDYPRMFIYVAMFVFAVAEAEFLLPLIGSPLNTLLSFGLIGVALLLFGLVLLVQFVRKYPAPVTEVNHVG